MTSQGRPLNVAVNVAANVAPLGRTLVLAPHPDDETIGCGGLLALLGRAGVAVQVVLFSDGAGSHRQSATYTAARLRALRQQEMTAALRALAHDAPCLEALGLPDGGIPAPGESGFDAVVERIGDIVRNFRPATVLMPTHDDEHPDHRATCAAGLAACRTAAPDALCLEYPVWGGTAAGRQAWQVDISAVVADKLRALALHRSQLGLVVHDDAQGFMLPPALLARCAQPAETYFVARGRPPDVCP